MSRIWSLTKEYVSRAKQPLLVAGVFTLPCVICISTLPIGTFLILFHFMGLYMLGFLALPRIITRITMLFAQLIRPSRSVFAFMGLFFLGMTVGIGLGTAIVLPMVYFIFPHYFLFFSALPFVITGTIFPLSVFLTSFELYIRRDTTSIGEEFSLVKIILNPRTRLDRLYRRLVPRTLALELSTTDRDALIDRQNRALNQLPDAAFIPLNAADFSTRNEHDSTRTLEAITQTINQAYLNSLTEAQQTYYKTYRALTINLRPDVATCIISAETVSLATQNNFILVEKRTLASGGGLFDSVGPINAVPAATFVYDRASFAQLQRTNPKIPETNDEISKPLDWNDRATEYKHHSYTMVQDHPLSLALCEAVEAFNVSLGLAPQAGSSIPKRSNTPWSPNAVQPEDISIVPTAFSYVSERQRQRIAARQLEAESAARRNGIAEQPPSSLQNLTYPPTLFGNHLTAATEEGAENALNASQSSSGTLQRTESPSFGAGG